MDITYTMKNGERFSTTKSEVPEFKNKKEKMRYILNFLNDRANEKASKLMGARFMFLKEKEDFFDTIEFTLGGESKDVDRLINIVFAQRN